MLEKLDLLRAKTDVFANRNWCIRFNWAQALFFFQIEQLGVCLGLAILESYYDFIPYVYFVFVFVVSTLLLMLVPHYLTTASESNICHGVSNKGFLLSAISLNKATLLCSVRIRGAMYFSGRTPFWNELWLCNMNVRKSMMIGTKNEHKQPKAFTEQDQYQWLSSL